MLPSFLKGAAPGYGKMPKVGSKGGYVTIKSVTDGKPTSRRVPIAPAFDSLAVSMAPIPGWVASPSFIDVDFLTGRAMRYVPLAA